MLGLKPAELILILAIVMLFFGAKKLPQLASGLGEAIRGFKRSVNEPDEKTVVTSALKEPDEKPQLPAAIPETAAKDLRPEPSMAAKA